MTAVYAQCIFSGEADGKKPLGNPNISQVLIPDTGYAFQKNRQDDK